MNTPRPPALAPGVQAPASFPRWALVPMAVGAVVVLGARLAGHQEEVSAFGHVLAIAPACALAAWLEHRIFVGLYRRSQGFRLLATLALTPAVLIAGLVLANVIDMVAAPLQLKGFAGATVLLASLWLIGSLVGTAVVIAIDAAVSRVAGRFRTRLVLAVLVLVGLVTLGAMGVAAGASEIVNRLRDGTLASISLDLGARPDSGATARFLAWVDAHPTRSMLFLYGLGLLFALPRAFRVSPPPLPPTNAPLLPSCPSSAGTRSPPSPAIDSLNAIT